jgi:hypothetical protein
MNTFSDQGFDVEPETEHAIEARRMVEQVAVKTAPPSLRVVNIKEMVETTLPPREQILAPWLQTQSLCMIHAWRGVGKTYVALGSAFAVASGGSFLGWQAPAPRRVLYLDGEMPGASLQSRLKALIANAKCDFDPDNFKIVTPDLQTGLMPDISTVQGQQAIYPLLQGVDLIIVDNLSTLARSGGRENDAESWQGIAEWALAMRQEGRSVLFIHHSGKGGGQRGTSKKEDILDTVISLKRPSDYQRDEGAKFEVHFEKGRDLHSEYAEPFEAALATDAQGNQRWVTSKLADATFDRVVALATEGLSQAEIGIELDIHKSNVSRHMRKARELGLLKADEK